MRWRLRSGLGVRPALRALFTGNSDRQEPSVGLGESSRFSIGESVRVLTAERLQATLDGRNRTRGLEFGKQQWTTCGGVYRVSGLVRRIIDDDGRLRRVARTVLLEDVHCDALGPSAGCGRACPMMYRDEWLEPAGDVSAALPEALVTPHGWATVRSAEEIERSLDILGRTASLLFMPEMLRYCGQTLPVERVVRRVWELEQWGDVGHSLFVLRGARCSGDVLGGDGPCHRACGILWHPAWLQIGAGAAQGNGD